LNIWDLAAGALIAEEAGAIVSDLDGSKNHLKSCNILAVNKGLYDQVFEVVRSNKNA
jgi:myo-inositol-1(or 4)-monophosphatase